MARSPTQEQLLERLAELRRDRDDVKVADELRAVLASRHGAAVASASKLAAERQLTAIVPDMVSAFDRFMKNPVKSDPNCLAKSAVTEALFQLNADEGDLYLRAVSHVQLEPVWGGRADTAAELRGAAGRALARTNHPDAVLMLAELLADPELPARIAAARALGYYGSSTSMPVLRHKALSGDAELEVISECLIALLEIDRAASVPFVARFLDAPEPALSEAAALALGESRSPEALPILADWWARTGDRDLSRIALLSIAMLRLGGAIQFLLGLIEEESALVAREAITALEIYREDEALMARVRATALGRDDVNLRETVDALGTAERDGG